MPLVFVYGTLMRGGCRSHALAEEEFLTLAKTEPRYRMYDCGTYPGLVEADDGLSVEGEIWRVSEACLARLDQVEGVPDGLYERCRIALQEPGFDEPVVGYLYRRDVTGMPDIGVRWRHR